jgi:hypothetical protein
MSKKKKQKQKIDNSAAASLTLEKGAGEKWTFNSPNTLALIIAIAVVIWFSVRIAIYAGDTVLFTDECYHAFRSEQFAHLDYPAAPKEVFSGYTDGQPPLFHTFGAVDFLLFGRPGLPYLNIFIYLMLAGFALYFTARYVSPVAAACVALAMFSTDILPQMALRYYQEILTALVFSVSLLFLYFACNRDEWKYSIIAGILLGLFLLTKQTAVAVPPVLLAFWIYFLIRKNWLKAKQFLVLGVIAVAIWSPHLYRQYAATGTPFFPAIIPSGVFNEDFIKLQNETWLKPVSVVVDKAVSSLGTVILILGAAGLIYALWRWFKRDAGYGLVAVTLVFGLAVFIFSGSDDDRRYLQFVPALCFLGVLAVDSALVKLNYKTAMYAVFLIVAIVAVVKVAGVPNYRLAFNIDPTLKKAQEYIRDDKDPGIPKDSQVFSVWTYSTYYYSGRNATWPQLAPNAPCDLFYVQTPDEFLNKCITRGIDYILVDYLKVQPEGQINSVIYPYQFMKCLIELERRGKASEFYPPRKVFDYAQGMMRHPSMGPVERQTLRRNYDDLGYPVLIPFDDPRFAHLGPLFFQGYKSIPRYVVYKINIRKERSDAGK